MTTLPANQEEDDGVQKQKRRKGGRRQIKRKRKPEQKEQQEEREKGDCDEAKTAPNATNGNKRIRLTPANTQGIQEEFGVEPGGQKARWGNGVSAGKTTGWKPNEKEMSASHAGLGHHDSGYGTQRETPNEKEIDHRNAGGMEQRGTPNAEDQYKDLNGDDLTAIQKMFTWFPGGVAILPDSAVRKLYDHIINQLNNTVGNENTELLGDNFHTQSLRDFLCKVEIASSVTELLAAIDKLLEPTTPRKDNNAQAPVPQTPLSHRVSTVSYGKQTRAQLDKVIKEELRQNLYLGIRHFAHTLITFNRSLYKPVWKELRNSIIFPKKTSEAEVVRWFMKCVESIRQAILAFPTSEDLPTSILDLLRTCFKERTPYSSCGKPLPGHNSNRKLDIGIFLGDNHRWSHALVIGELKANKNEDGQSSACQLASYAHVVFQTQPHRRFVHGFTICGSLLRLYMFDRGAAFSSRPYDLSTKLGSKRFLKVLLGYLTMQLHQLGHDPDVNADGTTMRVRITGKETIVPLSQLIYHEPHLFGRGTSCWKGTIDGKECVIKESWVYKDVLEAELFDILKANAESKPCPNVATCIGWETPQIDDKEDALFGAVRSNLVLPLRCRYKMQKKESGMVSEEYHYFSAETKAFREAEDKSENASNTAVYNRHRRRYLFTPVGVPLTRSCKSPHGCRFDHSPREILRAIHGGIQGHRQLYQNNILHRDISVNNILYLPTLQTGLLIDLDHSILLSSDPTNTEPRGNPNCTRTGTRIFMAISILQASATNHTVLEDLESFFWVLFFLIHPRDALNEWSHVSNAMLASYKLTLLNDQLTWDSQYKMLVEHGWRLWDRHEAGGPEGRNLLWRCLAELRDVVKGFQGRKLRDVSVDRCYEEFGNVLEKWAGKMEAGG